MTQTGLPQFDGLPISVVERETGIPKDLLRMWERRYGFPEPAPGPPHSECIADKRHKRMFAPAANLLFTIRLCPSPT